MASRLVNAKHNKIFNMTLSEQRYFNHKAMEETYLPRISSLTSANMYRSFQIQRLPQPMYSQDLTPHPLFQQTPDRLGQLAKVLL